MIKFGSVGLIGAIVDLGLLNLLHLKAGLSVYQATFWGFSAAVIVVYSLNNFWTFRHLNLPFSAGNLLKYTVIAGIGLAITEGIMHVLVGGYGLNYNLARIIAMGIVFFWNYFGNRWWIFRTPATQTSQT